MAALKPPHPAPTEVPRSLRGFLDAYLWVADFPVRDKIEAALSGKRELAEAMLRGKPDWEDARSFYRKLWRFLVISDPATDAAVNLIFGPKSWRVERGGR